MFSHKYLILRVVFGSILICSCFVISGIFSVQFDIRRDTFSTLGSWTSTNNPKCWYMFSIGLIISFIVVLPLISYQHQRIVYVNKILSFTVAICLLCGCISFIVIAFFPIVYQPIVPNGIVQFATIHKIFASSGCVLLLIGYFVLFAMVVMDQCKKKRIFGLAFQIALSLLITFFIIAVIVNITWFVMYPIKYKRDNSIGKSNEASAFTIFSFALWENLGIYFIFVFFLVSPFMLSIRTDGKFPLQSISKQLVPDINQVQLHTELSQKWYQLIIKRKMNQKSRKLCRFIEHLADYQLVEGLLDEEIVQILYSIIDQIECSEQNSVVTMNQYKQIMIQNDIIKTVNIIYKIKP
ncbi:Conserved_hypothetical protein [Hexamita inflata]|uniref:Uncharacterized protein n=1 Tax=Hexamita inflata TaxID=28002 RepID=A0AA86VCM2_9EUKA|nr:Conserved hypothetical protein [Hexamita inflata]